MMLTMTFGTTPKRISKVVRKFIKTLPRHSSPRYIDVTPITGCVSGNCHGNVFHQVATKGGHLQTGWVIWWNKRGRLIEAEYHSVWIDPAGRMIDPTPTVDSEIRLLFVPDMSTPIHLHKLNEPGYAPVRSRKNIVKRLNK